MQPIRLILLVISSLLLSSGVADAQSMQLFVAVTDGCGGSRGDSSGESTLYDTNPANAQSTQIGTIGFLGVTALEFLGDGRLVGSARDDLNGTKRATLIETPQQERDQE
jgi:hypothetical protein